MAKPTYGELEARNHDLLEAINAAHQWYTSLRGNRRRQIRVEVYMRLRKVAEGETVTRLDRVQLFKDAVFAACAVRNRDGAENWTTFDAIMEQLT